MKTDRRDALKLARSYRAGEQLAPSQMREVIEALQALRGIAKVSAVTIVAELGELSRFREARQLMAYSGTCAVMVVTSMGVQ